MKPPSSKRIKAMVKVANDSLRVFRTEVDGPQYVVETGLAHLSIATTKFGAFSGLGLEDTQGLTDSVYEFIRDEVQRRMAERDRRIIERN